ncbi:MAG: HPr(Ser) kinase/phosphatase, partial [Clostridia bacterium]|nr:HPr(Ser) kinase/phosphatase [Clostridia bacterium]
MIDLQEFITSLSLEVLSPTTRTELDISTADLNRPGMQFCGFYEYFAYERPQVIGKVEMTYLESLETEKRLEVLEAYMSYNLPCIIVCWGMNPPHELIDIAKKHDIPVLRSACKTTKLSFQAIMFLTRKLAPHVTRHGVLVDVYGVGVLLTGESGVGKSEAALELVKRGHQLVADDVVDICRVADDRLIGEAPEMVRHFMEIRGIGIIDIRAMYGVGSVIV